VFETHREHGSTTDFQSCHTERMEAFRTIEACKGLPHATAKCMFMMCQTCDPKCGTLKELASTRLVLVRPKSRKIHNFSVGMELGMCVFPCLSYIDNQAVWQGIRRDFGHLGKRNESNTGRLRLVDNLDESLHVSGSVLRLTTSTTIS
jgi:hypothetical protein